MLNKSKESQNNSSGGSGISFVGFLTILFIALKLTNHIEWSWFWVLSPIIFSTAITLLVVIAYLVIAALRIKR